MSEPTNTKEYIESLESKLSTLLKASEGMEKALDAASHELGVPQPGYPAPVYNACTIINNALADFRAVKDEQNLVSLSLRLLRSSQKGDQMKILKVGEKYTDKDGNEKVKFLEIGTMFKGRNGKTYVKLNHMPGALIHAFEVEKKDAPQDETL